jgi:hypothetical protein
MTDNQQTDSSEREVVPGKTRTLWHPLLARLLDYVLASEFTVQEEVLVGKMPLRVDILLIRRKGGQLSAARCQELSALLPLLNRFTLIEFKGPTDTLQRGDLGQLLGCSFLWHSQQSEPIPHSEVSLVILAPTGSKGFSDELRLLGCEAGQKEPGIHEVSGLPFGTWLVETDVMATRGQPVLSLVSHVFLDDLPRIMKELTQTGHHALLHFMVQQVHQFRTTEGFAMQHALSGDLEGFEEQLVTELMKWVPAEQRLRGLPPEDRLRGLPAEERLRGLPLEERLRGLPPEERLRGLPPEERLRGLPPEERLRGLSLEDRLAGLSEEEAARLREMIERKQGV